MTRHQSTPLVILLLLAAAAAIGGAAANRRFNLFEPVFADEESDTHTVSAGARSPGESAGYGQRTQPQNANSQVGAQSLLLPPRVDDLPRLQQPSAAPTPISSTKAELLKRLGASNEQKKNANAKRQIESFANNQAQPKVDNLTATSVRRARPTTEAPRHWSALESYYEKLRQSAVARAQQGKQLNPDEHLAFEQIVQEGVGDNSYRYQPIYLGDPNQATGGKQYRPVIASAVAQPPAPFLFPQVDQGAGRAQPAYLPASGQSGIGSGSLLLPGLQRHESTFEYTPTKSAGQQRPIQLEAMVPQLKSTQPQQQQQFQSLGWPPSTSGGALDGASHQLDNMNLRRLAEFLALQQQNRAKHQQEVYGSLFDERGARQQQMQEAYCGPLNQLPDQAAPGEFPSHMGLYNNSRTGDDDFLCAAAWVHERFALTLASCLGGLAPNVSLTVRTGEWVARRSWPNASAALVADFQKAAVISRPVARLHLFPRYQLNSSEHNLALLEWAEPVGVSVEMPYVVPACQMQPRSALRANNCWAPVRNITLREIFDHEGEGETKLQAEVKMVRVPVQLHASDDAECQRQTGLGYFNFGNPHYICSGDARPKSSWRAKLNNPNYFGSGVYCNEAGSLNLVSILHPLAASGPSAFGYLDLSYYQPWMRSVILGRSY